MKKIICLSIALMMLLATFVACKNDNGGTTDGEGSDTTDVVTTVETNDWGEEKQEHEVPVDDIDYQGMSIGIVVRPEERYKREFSSETMADPVDQRISRRNSQVQKELGITLNIIGNSAMWDDAKTYGVGLADYVTTEFQAGVNSEVNVVAAYAAYAVTKQLRGSYVNLIDKEEMPYLNTTKRYWNQDYVKAATCYEQLYYIVGDLNLTVYDRAHVVFANMSLAETNGINPDDIYDMVENKQWYYQNFYDIISNFSYLDNDGSLSVNAGDTIPLASVKASEGFDGFMRGWDIRLLQTNDDGSHTLTVDGNTKLDKAVTNLQAMYAVQGAHLADISSTFDKGFIPGNVLFDIDVLYRNATSNENLRNANFTYAVLPLPMYDETQEGYYTTPQDAYNAMSVIGHQPEKFEAIAATLEVLSSKSYDDVRPFYIEKMVKATYISGARQVKMLELVLGGISFDTYIVFAGQVNSVGIALIRSVCAKNKELTTVWGEISGETISAVQDFDAWFQATMD